LSDVVVTVPKGLWLDWIYEGDAVGEKPTGEEWGFFLGGPAPRIEPGERVYIVAHGLLRGYAPLTRVAKTDRGFALCRKAEAVAVTLAVPFKGFRGWMYRDWAREEERPFPEWAWKGVEAKSGVDRAMLDIVKQRFAGTAQEVRP
jgi:hypothetical protein